MARRKKNPEAEVLPPEGPIKITPLRPKNSRANGLPNVPSSLALKPVNKSAARALLDTVDSRDLYKRYLKLLAACRGNPIFALCKLQGIDYVTGDNKTVEQQQIEENWWQRHREICVQGAGFPNEDELIREVGLSREARIMVLGELMYAGSEEAALKAIKLLNEMEDSAISEEGERFEDWARMVLG